MSNNLTLNWTDPTLISGLKYPSQIESGIYIWGFTINNEFVPYYVGIANNIIDRIYEHISCILSGRYTIYDCNSLANFQKYQGMNPDMTKEKKYRPQWPYGYNDFLEKREELQPHIDFMVKTFTFSYAVVDEKFIKELKEIEKICISQIGKENLSNTRSGDSKTFHITHIGRSAIFSKMNEYNHKLE